MTPLRPDEIELLNLYNLLSQWEQGCILGSLTAQMEQLLQSHRIVRFPYCKTG